MLHEEARILRLLGTLVSAGVPFEDALPTVADTASIIGAALMQVHAKLGLGAKLSEAFSGWEMNYSAITVAVLGSDGLAGSIDQGAVLLDLSSTLEQQARLMDLNAPARVVNEVLFYRVLGLMLSASHGIFGSLQLAGDQYLSTEATKHLVKSVREGEMIVDGMKLSPEFFTDMDIGMVELSECLGAVPEVCARWASIKERLFLVSAPTACPLPAPDRARMDEMISYEQLALLIQGIPSRLGRSLEVIAGIVPLSKRNAFATLNEKVRGGMDLSEAMASLPKDFAPFVVQMVRAGEVNGTLEQVFAWILDYLKWDVLKDESQKFPEPVAA